MIERTIADRPRVSHLAALQSQRLNAFLQLHHSSGPRRTGQFEQLASLLQTQLGTWQRVVGNPEAGRAQRLWSFVVPSAFLFLLQLFAFLFFLDLLLDGVLTEAVGDCGEVFKSLVYFRLCKRMSYLANKSFNRRRRSAGPSPNKHTGSLRWRKFFFTSTSSVLTLI